MLRSAVAVVNRRRCLSPRSQRIQRRCPPAILRHVWDDPAGRPGRGSLHPPARLATVPVAWASRRCSAWPHEGQQRAWELQLAGLSLLRIAAASAAAWSFVGCGRPGPLTRLTELRAHLAGSDCHDARLHSADLAAADPESLGDAKVVFHSGVAAEGHGGGEVDEERLLLPKYLVVPRRVVEVLLRLLLLQR